MGADRRAGIWTRAPGRRPCRGGWADTGRARGPASDYEAEIGLDEGLRRLVEWWRRTRNERDDCRRIIEATGGARLGGRSSCRDRGGDPAQPAIGCWRGCARLLPDVGELESYHAAVADDAAPRRDLRTTSPTDFWQARRRLRDHRGQPRFVPAAARARSARPAPALSALRAAGANRRCGAAASRHLLRREPLRGVGGGAVHRHDGRRLRGACRIRLPRRGRYRHIRTFSMQSAEADTIGSPRHKLGYAYAPRLLDPSLGGAAEPMPAKLGQALIFGLSLVHGGGVNCSRPARGSPPTSGS